MSSRLRHTNRIRLPCSTSAVELFHAVMWICPYFDSEMYLLIVTGCATVVKPEWCFSRDISAALLVSCWSHLIAFASIMSAEAFYGSKCHRFRLVSRQRVSRIERVWKRSTRSGWEDRETAKPRTRSSFWNLVWEQHVWICTHLHHMWTVSFLFSNEAQHLVSIFTLLPTLSLCLVRSGVSD